MYKVYYNRVVSEQITFSEVPDNLKQDVLNYARLNVQMGTLSESDYIKFFGVQ